MKLVKCPRCDLNYIKEDEKHCKVCLRELKGEQSKDDIELCSVCNEAPALPGRDVCFLCLKEMSGNTRNQDTDMEEMVDDANIAIDPVSTMDEIIPEMNEDIPEREFGEIESELSSLESIREDEELGDEELEDEQQ